MNKGHIPKNKLSLVLKVMAMIGVVLVGAIAVIAALLTFHYWVNARRDQKDYNAAYATCHAKPVVILEGTDLNDSQQFSIVTPNSPDYSTAKSYSLITFDNPYDYVCSVAQAKKLLVSRGFFGQDSVNDSVLVDN